MDVQTLLIGLGVFVISALLIWLITSMTVRERPFEERMEHQRQMERELLLLDSRQSKHSPGTKKDKAKKKQSKKAKAVADNDVGNGLRNLADKEKDNGVKAKTSKMVELDIDPTVIETSADEPTIFTSKKKTSKSASPPVGGGKPILTNKGEKSAVRQSDEAPVMVHSRSVPKDAVELKHEHDRVDKQKLVKHTIAGRDEFAKEAGDKQVVGKHALEVVKGLGYSDVAPLVASSSTEVSKAPPAVNGASTNTKSKSHKQRESELHSDDAQGEVVVKAHVATTAASMQGPLVPDQQSKKKAKFNDTASIVGSSTEVDNLLECIHKSTLNDADARRIIDVLAARKLLTDDVAALTQTAESTKRGPKDPVVIFAKQLEEKKKEIEDEKHRTAVATDKVNELQHELSDMRQQMTAIIKQNNDQLTAQRQENVALAGHIKNLEAATAQLRTQVDPLKNQLAASHAEIQRITNENMHLAAKSQQLSGSEAKLDEMRQKVKIMDDALKSNALHNNTIENAKKTLEVKVQKLEEHNSFLEKSLRDTQIMAQHYNEAPEEMRKAELRIGTLTNELERVTAAAQRLEKELGAKQDELKLSENKLHDISRQKSEVEGRLRLADAQATELINSVKQKDLEIQASKAQLSEVLVELQLVREIPTSNSVVHNQPSEPAIEDSMVMSEVQMTSAAAPSGSSLLENGTSVESDKVELEKLREDLKHKEAECSKLRAELEILQHGDVDVQSECKDMKASLLSLTAQLGEMEKEQHETKSVLSQKEKQLIDVEARLLQKESDLAALKNHLDQKDADLANLESRVNQKDAEIADASSRLQQSTASSQDAETTIAPQSAEVPNMANFAELESRLRQKEADCVQLDDRLHQLDAKHADVVATLQQKEAVLVDVEARLHQREADYSDVTDRIKLKESEAGALEADLTGIKSSLQQRDAELEELRSCLHEKEAIVAAFETQLRQKESELAAIASETGQKQAESCEDATKQQALSDQLESIMGERNDLQTRLSKSEEEVDSLKRNLEDALLLKDNLNTYVDQVKELQSEIERLKLENSTLKESLNGMQSDLQASRTDGDATRQQELDSLHALLEEQRQNATRLEESLELAKNGGDDWLQVTETLRRLFPDRDISNESLKQHSWLSKFEQDVQQHLHKLSTAETDLCNLQSELDHSREAENKLSAQVQHYKNVLSETESILKRLQETVESEDQKNLQKVKLSEMNLQTANEELCKLREEMKGMHKTSECQDSIAERLQDTVETEEQKNLQIQLQTATEELCKLRDEMKGMHRTSECFTGASIPSVDHAECLIRKDMSKRHSLTELSKETEDAV